MEHSSPRARLAVAEFALTELKTTMKTLRASFAAHFTFLLSFFVINAHGQGTAFTYQGRLNSGGSPANGLYDFRFRVANDSAGNNLVGGPFLTNAVLVNSGLFVATIDFGPGVFNGSNYWLEVDVKTNLAGSYTVLSPLQALTPAPYAVFAGTASNLSGTLPAAQLSGNLPSGQFSGTYSSPVTLNNAGNSFSGGGSGLTGVNAAALGGLSSSNYWQVGGNNVAAGQFLGSTNNQAVEINVNGARGLRIEPNGSRSPNIIGGSFANVVGPGLAGVVIAGGGSTNIGGAVYSNAVMSSYANIGGGVGNFIDSGAALTTIAGGLVNTIQTGTSGAFIGGGGQNLIQTNSDSSVIGGGQANTILPEAWGSTITGGEANQIGDSSHQSFVGGGNQIFIGSNSPQSVINGGGQNAIFSDVANSTIGGGQNNTIETAATYATIAGGSQNTIESNSFQSTISGGLGNHIRADALNSTVAGGSQNIIQDGAYDSAISGGEQNTIQTNAGSSTIAGGTANTVQTNSIGGAIGGGAGNTIQTNSAYATISGGSGNSAVGLYGTVPGGDQNTAGQESFAAGHRAKAATTGAFVWADSIEADFAATANNQFLVRAVGGVGINTNNPQSALHVNGTVTATSFSGAFNASQITGGTLPLAQVPSAVVTNNENNVNLGGTFSGNGSALTNLNASRISSGTVPDARLSGNVALLSANQTFGGTNVFTAAVGINTNTPGATLDVNGSFRVGSGTTIFNNLQAGLAQMSTDSTTVKTNFTFTFPKAFNSVPNVLVSPRSSTDVDDTFAVTVRRVTTTTCTVNVVRTDSAAGWGQHMQVTWLAWE